MVDTATPQLVPSASSIQLQAAVVSATGCDLDAATQRVRNLKGTSRVRVAGVRGVLGRTLRAAVLMRVGIMGGHRDTGGLYVRGWFSTDRTDEQ